MNSQMREKNIVHCHKSQEESFEKELISGAKSYEKVRKDEDWEKVEEMH